jgi:hypothetical protein
MPQNEGYINRKQCNKKAKQGKFFTSALLLRQNIPSEKDTKIAGQSEMQG